MNAIDRLSESGTALVRRARSTLESGSSHLPQWLEAGAALSVAKTGTRVATTLVRRNPGVAIAVGVVGVGVLAYRFYRKRADARADAPRAAISGKVTRSNGTRVKVTAADKSEAKSGQAATERKPRARKAAKRTEDAKSSAE